MDSQDQYFLTDADNIGKLIINALHEFVGVDPESVLSITIDPSTVRCRVASRNEHGDFILNEKRDGVKSYEVSRRWR